MIIYGWDVGLDLSLPGLFCPRGQDTIDLCFGFFRFVYANFSVLLQAVLNRLENLYLYLQQTLFGRGVSERGIYCFHVRLSIRMSVCDAGFFLIS